MMYIGIPTSAANPKHISWRFVKLKAILVFTRLRSFGTVTNAIVTGKFFRAGFVHLNKTQTITRNKKCNGFVYWASLSKFSFPPFC